MHLLENLLKHAHLLGHLLEHAHLLEHVHLLEHLLIHKHKFKHLREHDHSGHLIYTKAPIQGVLQGLRFQSRCKSQAKVILQGLRLPTDMQIGVCRLTD